MAAYAALTSLKHIIDQLQNHPFPPISLHTQQVESLLQEFLEGNCNYKYHVGHSEEADPLEMRIADADTAYKAEDVIETEIVDQIRIRPTLGGKMITFFKFFRNLCRFTAPGEDLYRELQLVIEEMDLIKNETMAMNTAVQPQLQRNVSKAPRSSSSSTVQNNFTVGFDDVLIEVMEKLTGGGHQCQIIPIMGMGGIDPPSGKDAVVMESLQTLKTISNMKLNEEVVKRIPNIKKLDVKDEEIESNGDDYCFNNLECLDKLESFSSVSMDEGEKPSWV